MVATRSTTNLPQNELETAWGARLSSTEDALFLQGYRAFCREGSLLVRKPGGETYVVDLYRDTCSCPAGQVGRMCKHRRQTISLVFLSMSELSYRGKFDAYDQLANFWFQWCCHVGRNAR